MKDEPIGPDEVLYEMRKWRDFEEQMSKDKKSVKQRAIECVIGMLEKEEQQ